MNEASPPQPSRPRRSRSTLPLQPRQPRPGGSGLRGRARAARPAEGAGHPLRGGVRGQEEADPRYLTGAADQAVALASARCFAKNRNAVAVFVCCLPDTSTPTPVRWALASAATWNTSLGAHFVESSRILDPSG